MTDPEARRTIGKIIFVVSALSTIASVPWLLKGGSPFVPAFVAGLAGMAYGAFLIRFSRWRWP